jgi:hypothetical protein
VEHSFRAAGRYFEHCSKKGSAASNGGAVEIARRVPDQTGLRILAVRTPTEGVERAERAAGLHLEHCPHIGSGAFGGGAVEIAHRVPDQTGLRIVPVRTPGEAVDHPLRAAG